MFLLLLCCFSKVCHFIHLVTYSVTGVVKTDLSESHVEFFSFEKER